MVVAFAAVAVAAGSTASAATWISALQPSAGGGIHVFVQPVPDGGYVYLLYYDGPPGSGKTLVCGLHLRGVGDAPPPLVAPESVRSAIGGQSYRRTPDRVVSVSDNEVLFLDRKNCAHRDPGPPRKARETGP